MILCLLYTLQYRSVRGSFCQLQHLCLKSHHSTGAMLGCFHALLASRVIASSQLLQYPWTDISSHNTITFARIDLPLLRPYVQIDGTNELEERIIIRLGLSFFQPLVPPDQETHEDLDLLQCEVEADAHPLSSGETV